MFSRKCFPILRASGATLFPKGVATLPRTTSFLLANRHVDCHADGRRVHLTDSWANCRRFILPLALSSGLLVTGNSVVECGGDSSSASAASRMKNQKKGKKLQCSRCETKYYPTQFSKYQVKRTKRICKKCAAKAAANSGLTRKRSSPSSSAPKITKQKEGQKLKCSRCTTKCDRTQFSKYQLKRAKRICKICAAKAAANSGQSRRTNTKTCDACGETKPDTEFSSDRLRGKEEMVCRECAVLGRPRTTSIALGSQDCMCSHCGAALFKAEHDGFCCNHGKYAVDFSKYFRCPADDLLKVAIKVYMQHRPHLAIIGSPMLIILCV